MFLPDLCTVLCEPVAAGMLRHSSKPETWSVQFERKVIPEAQKAEQALKKNAELDAANTKLSAQVQVSNEKAKRCERSALKWQDQLDNEKAAHR